MTRTNRLIDDSRVALRHLAQARLVAEAAMAAVDDMEHRWARTPWSLGIAGTDLEARTEMLNFVCGQRVFDPAARSLGCAAFRVRRGAATVFRGFRDDGSTEHGAIPDREADQADTTEARRRESELRAELAERELQVADRARALPVLLREPLRTFWLWPIRWILGLLRRSALAAWRAAVSATEDTRGRLAMIEGSKVVPVERGLRERKRTERARAFARLRELASSTNVVREIELELAHGPLGEGIELLELTGASRAAAEVDAVVVIARDGIYAPAAADGVSLRIGDTADLIGALPELLSQARALRLACRVRDKLASSVKVLHQAVRSSEAGFRVRLDSLEAMRIADPPAFAAAEIARVHFEISASVQAIMEQASVQLGTELAELAAEWTGAIASATSSDDLKTVATRIEETWSPAAQRIANEVRILVMGGAEGSVFDLVPGVVGALVPYGLPQESLRAPRLKKPTLAPLDILPSLAHATSSKLGGTKQWLAGLFRSLEARRTAVHERVQQRIDHLGEVARAELLDAEPILRAALTDALRAQLDAGFDQQRVWLDAALAAEVTSIEQEREAVIEMIRVRDRVEHDLAWLRDAIGRVERELPVAAAVAAAASSLSAVFRPA
jgi:hypothetical protein